MCDVSLGRFKGRRIYNGRRLDNAMDELIALVGEFRSEMDCAFRKGLFSTDIVFKRFPKGCCGDTCYLLAEFLKEHGMRTVYVCGTFRGQSHAWLVLKDSSIHEPSPKYYTIPDEIRTLLKTYGEEVSDKSADISKYEERNLANGTLIDITADQFGQAPIYIGPMDCFTGSLFLILHMIIIA